MSAEQTKEMVIRLSADFDRLKVEWEIPGVFKSPPSSAYTKKNKLDVWTALLWQNQKLFFDFLPCDSIQTEVDSSVTQNQAIEGAAADFIGFVANTNELLKNNARLKNAARDFKKVLFLPFDSTPLFSQLASHAQTHHFSNFDVLQCRTGWDPVRRVWNSELIHAPDPITLIQQILGDQIGMIVTLNNYISEAWTSHHVCFHALMKFLGVEVMQIDIDNYDMTTYAQKAGQNNNENRRYCMIHHVQSAWDQLFGITNCRSVAGEFCPPNSQNFQSLEAGYQPLIIANARLNDFQGSIFPLVLEALEFTKDESIFVDVPLWLFSTRKLLLKREMPLEHKEEMNKLIFLVYLSCISFLKFEIIESLIKRGCRPVLFGDEAWKILFPEVYQNRFIPNAEADRLFASRKYLRLNMNNNFMIFENNFVYQRALAKRLPFLSSAPWNYPTGFEALRAFEYRSVEEIHQKIPKVNEIFSDPKLFEAIQRYERIIDSLATEVIEAAFHRSLDREPVESEFHQLCRQDWGASQARIDDYLHEHGPQLNEMLESWINKASYFQTKTSRFQKRLFVQRMQAYFAAAGGETRS